MKTNNNKELVELIVDSFLEGSSLDLNIARENQKYSSWFLAIATTGITLIITKSGDISSVSILGNSNASILLTTISLLLLISAICGAYVQFCVKQEMTLIQIRMAYLCREKIHVFNNELIDLEKKFTVRMLTEKILDGEFLYEDQKKRIEVASKYIEMFRKKSKYSLKLQQIITASCFILLIISAIQK